ncbi:MAG: mannose-6-phosphate isomerase, class I [Bifidobacterium sp.]|jgi:mannose-6-phosphate isomerase|nr:mannose-6-phosphate isomerase, class I [Bifidobacterium sp.]
MFRHDCGAGGDGPLAEMWFSGHAESPSMLDRADLGPISLRDAIGADATTMVGSHGSERFGPVLPFLFKIISARIPLSLQVHPVDFEARAGFNAQNADGVPLDSSIRSFKDPLAKHEMVVALEDFDACVGFAPVSRMLANLRIVDHPLARRMVTALSARAAWDGESSGTFPSADAMMPMAASVWPESWKRVFRAFHASITAPDGEGIGSALRVASARASGTRSAMAFRHALAAVEAFGDDPSIMSLLMLNPLSLRQGESVFIPAGTPHAYIHGTGAEIMTNSDNVLRAGMTVKHKDIASLLHTVSCRPSPSINPMGTRLDSFSLGDAVAYKPDLREFMLVYGRVDGDHQVWPLSQRLAQRYGRLSQRLNQRLNGAQGQRGPRVLLCTEGTVFCSTRSGGMLLERGDAVFICDAEGFATIRPAPEPRRSPDSQPYGVFLLASTQL